MNQASEYQHPAKSNDLSSDSDLTYTIPPSIAHEILHHRIPLLTDIMAFSVGIINVSKRLRTHDGGALHSQCQSEGLLLGPYLGRFCSEVERDQESDPEVEPSRQPCAVCYASIVQLTFRLCRILVLLFTPAPCYWKDNSPFIFLMLQIDVQRLRDALADMYSTSKMVSIGECYCLSHAPAEWCLENKVDYHPLTIRESGFPNESDIHFTCPWTVDGIPDALRDFGAFSGYRRRHPDIDPDIYLQLLADAENKLARETVTPYGISPYMEGTVELSPKSCAGGGWSEVYVGSYCAGGDSTTASKVAIKLIRIFGPQSETNPKSLSKVIQAEMDVWVLARHPHLLPLYGVHWDDDVPRLVSPWCGNGDIVNFVSRHDPSLQFDLALRLLEEVVLGLEYLHTHTPTIVHCDLKGANILISDDGKALIADFGLARVQAEVTAASFKAMSSSSPKGTYRWMAPELLFFDDARPTTSSDIWSFACVVVETLTGRVPYHRLTENQVYIAISNGRVPARPDYVDDDLWTALKHCWRVSPADRPSASRLRDIIAIARPESV